ncbi:MULTISPECIES: hypothetical protein [Bacillus]|uniref:hypothetical protein n=1 Tax=Bacillus TaxID=1386 RepID=UPI0012AB284D|nr:MULTISPECIES: hypothetical protein [Bacillus amyloliquefaciens group]
MPSVVYAADGPLYNAEELLKHIKAADLLAIPWEIKKLEDGYSYLILGVSRDKEDE